MVGRLDDFIQYDQIDPYVNFLPDDYNTNIILPRLTQSKWP